ncbi:Toxin RelG [Wolbachia endosymbiont of Cylisticus convexus]|uniref:Type II toxin-antitoxin system mRNA interferase toxin, RelE/StbE family n=1 Tax=Wolbachia endosymbiont of Armadillidium arcangelii TaxID=3158571 RepID=A0AAU7Q3L2_9RICK|nr:type II toxin-antitoxin system mRNA interferase toxin, RelE/StbE family [Wolbachia endosymbiont of Cylisticus convexus]RDD34972.1 Toxin RelG [Wolbachia endosymbiont of Cylisticus convexus]
MKYEVDYPEKIFKRDFRPLSPEIRKKIKKLIEDEIAFNPFKVGKPLSGNLKGYRSFRTKDCRIVYRINIAEHKIIPASVGYRKDVYDKIPLDLL